MRIYQKSQLFSVQILSTQLLQNFLGKKISTPLPRYIALLCVCVWLQKKLAEKTPTQIKREFGSLIFSFPCFGKQAEGNSIP